MKIYLTSDEWHSDLEVQRYYSLKKYQEKFEKTLSEKSPEYLKKYNELLEKLLGEFDMEKKSAVKLIPRSINEERDCRIFKRWDKKK